MEVRSLKLSSQVMGALTQQSEMWLEGTWKRRLAEISSEIHYAYMLQYGEYHQGLNSQLGQLTQLLSKPRFTKFSRLPEMVTGKMKTSSTYRRPSVPPPF